MASTLNFYNSWKNFMPSDPIDVNSSTFKLSLHTSTYVPNVATDTVFANATNELATANGYTAGGSTLTGVTYTQSGATCTWTAANVVWTASGGSIVARYAVLRASGTFNGHVDPLVAYILMDTTPADVTTTTGNTLTIQWNGSGIWQLV